MTEEVRRHHRDLQTGLGERCLERLDPGAAFDVRGAEGDQVVVVEGQAVGTQLSEPVHRFHSVERGSGGRAEWVTGLPTDSPQPKGELVGRGGIGHVGLRVEICSVDKLRPGGRGTVNGP